MIKLSDPLFSNQLSVVVDEQWKRLRAVITPTFSTGKIRRMKPCIDDICKTLMTNFEMCAPFGEMKQLAGAFTMDTIAQVAFGVRIDSLVDVDNPLVTNARKLFSTDLSAKNLLFFAIIALSPRLTKAFGIRFNKDVVDFFEDFCKKLIKQKRDLFKNKEQIGKAVNFIELMFEAEAENNLMKQNSVEAETDSKLFKCMFSIYIIFGN